jgi:Na+/melibiose symporter-like transporter
LISYCSSVPTSLFLNKFYQKFGRKKALITGAIICVISLGVMLILNSGTSGKIAIMCVLSVFIGISQMMVLSTGINLISDVVGSKAKTGAFVFGIYSLLDKFSAGIVIFLVGRT